MAEVQILNKQHPAVQYLCSKDKRLAKLIDMVGDIEYRTQPDCFSRLVRSIINQMLSNKASHVIGGSITPENLLKQARELLQNAGLSYISLNDKLVTPLCSTTKKAEQNAVKNFNFILLQPIKL